MVVIPLAASSSQLIYLKHSRDEPEVTADSLAVPLPAGMSRTSSFESVGSDKRARVDLWSGHRGSPIPSEFGASGASSFSLCSPGRPPSEEEFKLWRNQHDEEAFEEILTRGLREVELARTKYEASHSLYQTRFKWDWAGHHE